MPKSKKKATTLDPLPESFDSLEDFWTFWDNHSTADYEDHMQEVAAQVNLRSSKVYCPVAKNIIVQLKSQARKQGVSTETLINLWLREKVTEAARGK